MGGDTWVTCPVPAAAILVEMVPGSRAPGTVSLLATAAVGGTVAAVGGARGRGPCVAASMGVGAAVAAAAPLAEKEGAVTGGRARLTTRTSATGRRSSCRCRHPNPAGWVPGGASGTTAVAGDGRAPKPTCSIPSGSPIPASTATVEAGGGARGEGVGVAAEGAVAAAAAGEGAGRVAGVTARAAASLCRLAGDRQTGTGGAKTAVRTGASGAATGHLRPQTEEGMVGAAVGSGSGRRSTTLRRARPRQGAFRWRGGRWLRGVGDTAAMGRDRGAAGWAAARNSNSRRWGLQCSEWTPWIGACRRTWNTSAVAVAAVVAKDRLAVGDAR